MEGVIGPGQPCASCAGTYGQHSMACPVPKERRKVQREADERRGKELLAAIEKKDAVAIGRVLRGGE